MDTIVLIIVLVVSLYLSTYYSAAETAYSSVNKIRLRYYASKNKPGSKKALYITEHFDEALSTILIGNNITNVAATSIGTTVAAKLFGEGAGLLISTIVMTIIILIFAEILPKTIANENAGKYSLKYSRSLLFQMRLLTPVNVLNHKLKEFVSKKFGKTENLPSITEEEIKLLVDISEKEGIINKDEKELVHRTLALKEIMVGEIFTPRMDIIAVEVNQSIEEIKKVFLKERYSKIPVYKENIDNIIGFLTEREFMSELIQHNEVNIAKLLRYPLFVENSMSSGSLMHKLQRTKSQMAIVVDEFGGTFGLITLEDILEVLVGDIWDEHDEKIMVKKLDESLYKVDTRFKLKEFVELFNVPMPETQAHTLGGWIFEKLERIPKEGKTFQFENLQITVHEVNHYRIRKVMIEILPIENEE
ncbi:MULTISPECIES: hemolysin family protein [unclassified Bacillus (in: firmicutes)]|uniref:hemolysin family protein n=1 Tax=unclassified Bacillus (in: firmicutes) TaxID=185979 RepID=UPI001C2D39D4|nr:MULTISPECIES: hemolysin family protein [unclassified Bacillus (in: firmicutes)]